MHWGPAWGLGLCCTSAQAKLGAYRASCGGHICLFGPLLIKISDWVGYRPEPFIFTVLEPGKSNIKAPADGVSGKSELCVTPAYCVLTWWKWSGCSLGSFL